MNNSPTRTETHSSPVNRSERMRFYINMNGAMDDGFVKHWITPTVCIGDWRSSYTEFDVVVNANMPHNLIAHRKIGRMEETLNGRTCTLYLVGMYDSDTEDLNGYLEILLPRLKKRYEQDPNTTFLFHCFAGKSRSVVIALAFLVEVMGMTFEAAYELVKTKRPIIEPRPSFIEGLRPLTASPLDISKLTITTSPLKI